jgi:uncharacterized RDD family membrane protein YckC
MSGESDPREVRFEPLHPASRKRLIVALIVGPILWLVALIVVAVVVKNTRAIGVGLVVVVGSCLIAIVVLNVLLSARRREERRYDDR